MMERYQVVIPWLLAQFGVRRWLKDRALHCPERYAAGLAELLGSNPYPSGTVDWLRWQEQRLIALVYDGLPVRVSGAGE